MNRLRERITRIKITDQGNMLRAYARRRQCDQQLPEVATFIPALAYTFARNPAEVVVEHEERAAGESKYSLYSLIRLNFDLMTGFSLVPLQWFSMLGILVSLGSAALFVLLIVRRLIVGPEAEGLFTLFALMFFLIGLALFGIGLLGEYVGRVYQQVRHRPRYLVHAVLERSQKIAAPENEHAPSSSPTTTSACAACRCCWPMASMSPWW
jgi:undecaprenyl-phosphate 4-deoxy-4-formamido-L-arabinose transferase